MAVSRILRHHSIGELVRDVSLAFKRPLAARYLTTDSAGAPSRPFADIPGPNPIPLLGNVWRFFPVIGDLGNIDRVVFVEELHKRYGHLVRLDGLFGRPKLFVADPTLIEQVLRNEGKWPSREGTECWKIYYDTVRSNQHKLKLPLGTSEGEVWQQLRSKVNPIVMQPRTVKNYLQRVDSVSAQFLERMRDIRDENLELPENFEWELGKWAMEAITYICLDVRLGALASDLPEEAEAARMLRAVRSAMDAGFHLEFGVSPYRLFSTPTWRKFKLNMDYFTDIAVAYVQLALERLHSQSYVEEEDRSLTVLEKILVKFDYDPMQAAAIVVDLLFGGVDTTSNQMALVMYQLATHPEQQRTLQEELDREIPDPSQPLTNAVLERLRYVRAVIKETFRLVPAVNVMNRIIPNDLVLQGYLVPRGTSVVCSHGVPAADERFVPRPTEFLPERWLKGPGQEQLKVKNPFVYLPFGFGARVCIGKRFADLELEVLTTKLFRSYSLEWRYPPPKLDRFIMLTHTSPLKFTMKER